MSLFVNLVSLITEEKRFSNDKKRLRSSVCPSFVVTGSYIRAFDWYPKWRP